MLIVEKKEMSGLKIETHLLTKEQIRKGRFVCYWHNNKWNLMKITWLEKDHIQMVAVIADSMLGKIKISKTDFTNQCYAFMLVSEDNAEIQVSAEVFITPSNWKPLLSDYTKNEPVSAVITTKKFTCRCTHLCEKGEREFPCSKSVNLIYEGRIIPGNKIRDNAALSVLSRYNEEIINMLKSNFKGEILEEELDLVYDFLYENNAKFNES